MREKKALRKVDSVDWLSPSFCQDKSGGGTKLLTDLQKLNEILERVEWPLENMDRMFNNIGTLNFTEKIDQVM